MSRISATVSVDEPTAQAIDSSGLSKSLLYRLGWSVARGLRLSELTMEEMAEVDAAIREGWPAMGMPVPAPLADHDAALRALLLSLMEDHGEAYVHDWLRRKGDPAPEQTIALAREG